MGTQNSGERKLKYITEFFTLEKLIEIQGIPPVDVLYYTCIKQADSLTSLHIAMYTLVNKRMHS